MEAAFGLYSGILGVLLFKISLDTISARRKNKISLGVGKNKEIEPFVSAHSNFVGYVPLFLILLYSLSKFEQFPLFAFHIIGSLFVFGRILHFKAMTAGEMDFKNRVRGMKLTLFPIMIAAILNVVFSIWSLV